MQKHKSSQAISRLVQRTQQQAAAGALTAARVAEIAERHTAYRDQPLCLRGAAVQDFAKDLLAEAGVRAAL